MMLRSLILMALLFTGTDAMAQVGYTFTGKDAGSAMVTALGGDASNTRVTLYGARDEEILASSPAPISAQVDGLNVDREHDRFEATLLLNAGGQNLAPIKLTGRYEAMTQVPVLKNRMQTGDIISRDDIDWMSVPANTLRKTVTDPQQLIGKSPKRMISQDRPIREDEVAGPTLIAKGTRVTLLFQSGNIEIKTLGEALDSGARGDVIRVRNITSKAIVQGTVATADTVRVSAAESTSAEAL